MKLAVGIQGWASDKLRRRPTQHWKLRVQSSTETPATSHGIFTTYAWFSLGCIALYVDWNSCAVRMVFETSRERTSVTNDM
eukprot:5603813-Amphidinium_carterae.2